MNQGRINIMNQVDSQYDLYENNKNKDNFHDTTNNIINQTKIGSIFFSRRNIDFLHNMIINQVYKLSNKNFIIGKQNELQLEIIMRSVYLQDSKFLDCKLKEQLSDLNKKVIIICSDKIINEIKQYMGYKKDVSSTVMPLEHPKNLSSTGTKVLSPNIGFSKFN